MHANRRLDGSRTFQLASGLALGAAVSLCSAASAQDAPIIWYASQLGPTRSAAAWGGACAVAPIEAGDGIYLCEEEAKLDFQGDYTCPWGSMECNGPANDYLSYSDIWRLYYDPQGEVRVKYDAKVGETLSNGGRPPSYGLAVGIPALRNIKDVEVYYGHVQGLGRIQRNDAFYMVASSSHFQASGRAGFWVAKLSSSQTYDNLIEHKSNGKNIGSAVAFYAMDDTVHPGGLQVLGKYALISKECAGSTLSCDGRGGVEVWDLEDPVRAKRVKNVVLDVGLTTIPGSPARASSVAATRLLGGRYLILVAGRKTEELWFYMTKTNDLTSDWLMVDHLLMADAPSDVRKEWMDYQNLSMFVDKAGHIYVLATQGEGGAINVVRESIGKAGPFGQLIMDPKPTDNYFDAYEVLPDPEHGVTLRFLPVDPFSWQTGSAPTFSYPMDDYCSAAGGAGAYVTPKGTMAIYCHSDIPNGSGEHKILQLSRGYTE